MQILVVEDEKRLARALEEILVNKKHRVDVVFNGEDGLNYGLSGIYDCIVMDVMMPKMNGFEVVKKLREEHISTPIIMLTAKDSVYDKVNGLDLGADDYMTKPFDALELLARINVITRRKGEVIVDKITYGDLEFLISSRELRNVNNDKIVRLNFKEAEIISLFMKMPNMIMSKEDIITKVWGYDSDASDNNVEAYISFVRKKMSFLGTNCEISAIKKVGYVFGDKK